MEIKPYLLPLIILIGGSLLIITGVYRHLDFVYNKDKSIALMISAFGLLFAVFQVVLNNNLQAVRNINSLRHIEYKEFLKLLNSISDILFDGIVSNMKVEAMYTSLMNKRNEFSTFIHSNNTFLFKGIIENKVLKETFNTVVKMVNCTDKYRNDRKRLETLPELLMQRHMDWKKEMEPIVNDYHGIRHEAAKELQKYILY